MITRKQLFDVGYTILESSKSDIVRLQLDYADRTVTRVANSKILTSDNGESIDLRVVTVKGGKFPISMNLNLVDEESIHAAVKMLDELAKDQIGPGREFGRALEGPQEYLPVSLWHDATVNAMATVNESVVPGIIESLRSSKLLGSGFVGLIAKRRLVMQKDGLVAFHEETDSEVTVSARTADGRASGWWGQDARDWSKIDVGTVTSKAIDMATRSMNPYAVEPGRRTAILSPFAVGQILRYVASQFNAYATNRQKATAFTVMGDPNRSNKLGLKVLDSRLRITSDPADPEGGYIPFGDIRFDGIAMPVQSKTYVVDGILKDLSYDLSYGLKEGRAFSQNPWSMRFEAREGTPLLTLEEMIESCRDGIYINRLSDVNQLDSRTGMQTGVTRDGCFLIKNGKIDRPVKNFRFTDSPFFFFNNILAIGKAERTAMGYMQPSQEPLYVSEWPRRPMIVPPVMVADFNLTALSDAV